jgi:hypothetical protein
MALRLSVAARGAAPGEGPPALPGQQCLHDLEVTVTGMALTAVANVRFVPIRRSG